MVDIAKSDLNLTKLLLRIFLKKINNIILIKIIDQMINLIT